MKVEITWATTESATHKTTLDWEEDLTPKMRREIERELGLEDGEWPELDEEHELPELETSVQLSDYEGDDSLVGADVESRYATAITFRDPTLEETFGPPDPQPPLARGGYSIPIGANPVISGMLDASVKRAREIVAAGHTTDYIIPAQPPTREELERMILTVRSNGYDVTKQDEPGGVEYVNDLLDWAHGLPNQLVTTDHEQAKLSQLVNAVGLDAEHHDVEIYVEIDRALLLSQFEKAIASHEYGPGSDQGELWMHLWPVVIRVDEQGDIVLHATSAERAQFGAGGKR